MSGSRLAAGATRLSENVYLSAVRAGMVAVVPLTIVGGVFMIFQINEPIFFGLPIVLNPVFMIPYVLSALTLTAGTYLLMEWNVIQKPFVNVPWTTPPVVGHYLVSGGDWRAAVWGAASIAIAMLVYLPFAKAAERRRVRAQDV